MANYDIQVEEVINTCNRLLNHAPYTESFTLLKGLPKLQTEFGLIDYTKSYYDWYCKSKMVVPEIPTLANVVGVKPDKGYVKTADLVPGHVYYSGSGWRSLYLYLGRTTKKKAFVWHFIGNCDNMYEQGLNYILHHGIERSTSNKKVKDIANIRNDSSAFISSEIADIERFGCEVDITSLTQDMLDYYFDR